MHLKKCLVDVSVIDDQVKIMTKGEASTKFDTSTVPRLSCISLYRWAEKNMYGQLEKTCMGNRQCKSILTRRSREVGDGRALPDINETM